MVIVVVGIEVFSVAIDVVIFVAIDVVFAIIFVSRVKSIQGHFHFVFMTLDFVQQFLQDVRNL